MRHEREPSLKDQCDDTSPVEQEAGSEVILHVMPVDMVHNEWECVEKRKDKESI